MAKRKTPKARKGGAKTKVRAKATTKAKAGAKPKAKPRAAAPLLLLPAQAGSVRAAVGRRWRRFGLAGAYAVVAVVLGAGLLASVVHLNNAPQPPVAAVARGRHSGYYQLRYLRGQAKALEAAQNQAGVQVDSNSQLDQQLTAIQISLESGNKAVARALMAKLKQELAAAGPKLAAAIAAKQAAAAATAAAAKAAVPVAPAPPPVASANVPILIYHKPPDDFDAQMDILQQRGYTTITLDQLAAALQRRGSLPAKPIVITFDDGFEAQESAVPYLEAHNLKATFFIIDGGAASNYCIGANRSNASCGDAYMTWDEIRGLDQNPLFTIGSHTVDHLDLSQQTPAVQWFQIDQGKVQLEAQLGHSVDDFAYPDGGYTGTTLSLVHQAGFVAAVTTNPGTIQSAGGLLTLSRIRTTDYLP